MSYYPIYLNSQRNDQSRNRCTAEPETEEGQPLGGVGPHHLNQRCYSIAEYIGTPCPSSVQNHDHTIILPQNHSEEGDPTQQFHSNTKDRKRSVDAGHQRAVEQIHSKHLPLLSSSSVPGGATTRCTFCEGETVIIPSLDLVVPKTGGQTCRSIKSMTATEIEGSAICSTLQKEEKVCCPDSSSLQSLRGEGEGGVQLSNSTASSSFYSWEQAHCWRKREVGNRSTYNLLITGAGYSSTGFFASTFTKAGYPVGHERFMADSVGISDWLMSSRRNQHSPFKFKHIFLLVRHPLKVLHSEYGTRWDFKWTSKSGITSDVANNETLLGPDEFNKLAIEFKTLEWWLLYTLLGENIAECYVRNEDISGELFLNMCLKSELPNCETKNWESLTNNTKKYNRHNTRTDDQVTWEDLKSMVKTENENIVLSHARQVCLKFYSGEDC